MLCLIAAPDYSLCFSMHGNMTPVNMKSGLNNNTVYDIYRGQKGYVWFSTDMGISRYDGFRFRNYPLISNKDASSQPILHAVRSISQDTDSLFYLRLLQGGMACFDAEKEVYLPVVFDSDFDERSITSLYIVDKHFVCIGTTHGLYNGKVERSGSGEDDRISIHLSQTPIIEGPVTQLCGEGKNRVYACVGHSGVMVYNVDTGKVETVANEEDNKKVIAFCLHGNYLWICYSRSPVKGYDLKRKTLFTITADSRGDDALLDTYVTDLVCVDENTYYASTWNGLYRLEFNSKDLSRAACRIECVEQTKDAGTENKMTSLMWDGEQKMLWAGTFGSGAIKTDFTKDAYNRLEQQIGGDITAIEEDIKGYIWVTTGRGQVWRSTSNVLTVHTSFALWTKGINSNENYCIYKDKSGRLWLGDENAGVLHIDPSTDEVKSFRLAPEGTEQFSAAIRQFCLDSRNRLWIATTQGLALFDPKENSCRLLPMKDNGVDVKEVRAIAEDKEGNIWLGTDIGLKRIEVLGEKVSLTGNYECEAGLEVSPVYSIYVNSYNQIFVSYSDKVLRIDGRQKDKVESAFTLMNGLSSGHIFCMVDDQNGNTWLGSNSGIMTIRNDRTSFYNYASFGNCNRVCRLRDGRLLWANSRGLIFFDPLMAKSTLVKNRLRATEMRVNGETVSVGKKVNGQVLLDFIPCLQKSFVLNAYNDDFTFYFSDLQFGMMQRKMAYRLLPDEEWKMGRWKMVFRTGGCRWENTPCR